MKSSEFCAFRAAVSALDARIARGIEAEQDCPRPDPPASMIMGSRGSITPVNVSQPVSPGVVSESVWRFSQHQERGILPGGGVL